MVNVSVIHPFYPTIARCHGVQRRAQHCKITFQQRWKQLRYWPPSVAWHSSINPSRGNFCNTASIWSNSYCDILFPHLFFWRAIISLLKLRNIRLRPVNKGCHMTKDTNENRAIDFTIFPTFRFTETPYFSDPPSDHFRIVCNAVPVKAIKIRSKSTTSNCKYLYPANKAVKV